MLTQVIPDLKTYLVSVFIWLFSLAISTTALAQPDEKFDYLNKNPLTVNSGETKVKDFFNEEEVLRFNLSLNYHDLLKDRGEERGYHKAVVSYQDQTGSTVAVEAKVMVRGNHRRNVNICRFPPLTINFSRKTTTKSIFQQLNKSKLVTHCLSDDYIFRELLAYKIYNFLTPHSFRVRLCRIDYIDTQSKRKTESRYAFMIEDDTELAKRTKTTLVPKEYFITMDKADPQAMVRVALFQYLIGNTDWSVPYRHNIKLIKTDDAGSPIPVPYDFDYCGLVGAPYAVPPPELGITSVRQRLYRGYHFPNDIYAEAKQTFIAQKENIYNLFWNNGYLEKSFRKQSIGYLDSFYKTLENPKTFQTNIVNIGLKNQKNYVVVKGLK